MQCNTLEEKRLLYYRCMTIEAGDIMSDLMSYRLIMILGSWTMDRLGAATVVGGKRYRSKVEESKKGRLGRGGSWRQSLIVEGKPGGASTGAR